MTEQIQSRQASVVCKMNIKVYAVFLLLLLCQVSKIGKHEAKHFVKGLNLIIITWCYFCLKVCFVLARLPTGTSGCGGCDFGNTAGTTPGSPPPNAYDDDDDDWLGLTWSQGYNLWRPMISLQRSWSFIASCVNQFPCFEQFI